ncbi:MAG: hypothetical protein HYV77_03630 [Candidatus Wildermuthbacteria bacterium]|nr:hypothetical protein [Candidatus Wildermuthbacteria bacterium]
MINLLPASFKQELQAEERLRVFVTLGIALFAGLLALALILLSLLLYGKQVLVTQKSQFITFSSQSSQVQDMKNKILEQNTFFSQLSAAYASQVAASSVLEEVEKSLPPEVILTSLTYSVVDDASKGNAQKKYTVSITGFSPTREILLGELYARFKENPRFKDVAIPHSSWANFPVNVNFPVSFEYIPPK